MLPLADSQARPVIPAASPAGDALAALEAVTAGLGLRFGMGQLAAHEVAAHLTAAMVLAPWLAAVPVNASLSGLAAAGCS